LVIRFFGNVSPNTGPAVVHYTVIQNFGFSLPKHSVLKNLPKLPIIQQKFRVKSTINVLEVSKRKKITVYALVSFRTPAIALSEIRTRNFWVSSWQCYHLSHSLHSRDISILQFTRPKYHTHTKFLCSKSLLC
jgi:hypothetical protein